MFINAYKICEQRKLQLKLEKIQIMKWLLGIEENNQKVTLEDLQEGINKIAHNNLSYLTVIHQMVIQLPNTMKKIFLKLSTLEENNIEYTKLYEKFKLDVKYNDDFIEFERYVYLQTNYDSRMDWDYSSGIIEERKMYNILLFNILDGFIDALHFQKENYLYNFHKLYKWVNEYQNKPIKDLTDDECKIIIGIFQLMPFDEMIESLDLNISNQNYDAIQKIILELPTKFYVQNITQMMFRIILIKPYLFGLFENDLIIKGLKGLNKCITMT